jgi:uncharacterized membrane protein
MTPGNTPKSLLSTRLQSIDALRGLIILLMLLDHVRETFFLHQQVADPMDVSNTEPALFFSRSLAHLCAPMFIFLSGLSAFLYGEKHQSKTAVTSFLCKRGLFLVALEFTLVNFAWTFQAPPSVIYLQVIWAIGLSMLALSVLIWLPRTLLVILGLLIIGGHNLLDQLSFARESALYIPWAILHDRGWIELSESLRLRTSYPVLPWIGVIALGYAAGPWFSPATPAAQRRNYLLLSGLLAVGLFALLRLFNGYGEQPWQAQDSSLLTLMSIFNITKYPPSLQFLALTLGLGLLLLRGLERVQNHAWIRPLSAFGGAPMFFYLLHLYVLKLLYLAAVATWGLNKGDFFGFDQVAAVWLCAALLAVALYPATRWFAALKARRRDITWLKYF